MINADNFIFVGPTVPFEGKNPLYSDFIFISLFCMSSNDKHKSHERMSSTCLTDCTNADGKYPPPSANASCHTSLFRVPKTALRPPQFRLQPLTEPLIDVMIPE